MKLFVTGVEGYIGSVLAPMLLAEGHEVVGLDTGYYRDGWLYSDRQQMARFPQMINKDLRDITAADIAGCDAIVHLAELSNDPLGQNKPEITHQINHGGSVALAKLAKSAGIGRFVYFSSCSVYGVGSPDAILTERDPVNPQTAYAECKVKVERDVGAMADATFSPVFLRNATAYGASPRMRFDIVLNNLAGLAWTQKSIAMTSDGTPWRPLVHIGDICRAAISAATAPKEAVHNQIFNVGHNGDNYRVREIAEIVGRNFPGCSVSMGTNGADNRSYRVNFDKITHQLPGFKAIWTAEKGAAQLRDLFQRIDMPAETFTFRAFTRLRQLEYLIRTKQIDDAFYWQR